MTPQITLLTLGVDDLERAVAFYRDGQGFGTKGILVAEFESGAVVKGRVPDHGPCVPTWSNEQ